MLGDHISKATIEAEEKSDEHPGFYIWGSQLDDIATSSLGHVRIRIKMMKEGDSTNFESRKWPGILGNEAVRQLPCLPMELSRSLPDQAPDTQQMFNYHLQLPKTTTDINGLSVVCGQGTLQDWYYCSDQSQGCPRGDHRQPCRQEQLQGAGHVC